MALIYLVVMLLIALLWLGNARAQKRRIALLASHLGEFQIEQRMETVIDGYLRALAETNAERQAAIWSTLAATEVQLCQQIKALSAEFSLVDAPLAQFSALPLPLGLVLPLPLSFAALGRVQLDMRQLLQLHSAGIDKVVHHSHTLATKERAYMLTAELLLFQHSCHWYCRSKAMAHARMRARHQTPYAQLLASVSPSTRLAYTRYTGATV